MKKSMGEIRNMIKEELMVGVPEYQFRNASSDYIDAIKKLLRRNILLDKSKTPAQRQQAFIIASKLMKELEEDVNEKMQDTLHRFDQNT
jgi:hypothetical protein